MKTALIGHTGFVGSNVASRHGFDDLYNTKNIADIAGQEYDLVVTAANRADAYRINRNAKADLDEINNLIDHLSRAAIDRLVLISTVCVYPGATSPDEATPLGTAGLTPYGANRLHQERRLADLFDTTILRLPQLYGDNLKKGLIYDLANDNRVEFIDPDGEFQYYDARDLWSLIEKVLHLGIETLNVSTPPISHLRVAQDVFGVDISNNIPNNEDVFSSMYTRDMRTRHAGLLGGQDGYLTDLEGELRGIRDFVAETASRSDLDHVP